MDVTITEHHFGLFSNLKLTLFDLANTWQFLYSTPRSTWNGFFFKKKCMGILVEHSIKQNYLQNLHFLPHWGFFHVWSFHIITFVTKKVASLEILSLVLEMNHTLYSLPLTREGQTLPWFHFNVRGIRIIYHLHVDAVTRALGLEGITLLTLDHNVDLSIPGQHVDMRF